MSDRRGRHDRALFTLVPHNERAKAILELTENEVSELKGGILGLDVGHKVSGSGDPWTLATIGRNADIKIQGAMISRIHCAFEIHKDSKLVLFHDRSSNQSCQVYGKQQGEDVFPFEPGRPRKVVITNEVNRVIGIGGEKKDLLMFKVEWNSKVASIAGLVREITQRAKVSLEPLSHLALTADEPATELQSLRQTRLHTAGPQRLPMRSTRIDCLGSGSFGWVFKEIDVDLGVLMAVKMLKRANTKEFAKSWPSIKREIEFLSAVNHENIISYFDAQGWSSPSCEVSIFMELGDGNLNDLVESAQHEERVRIADAFFPQMLRALDYLANKKLIHRDLKPENILYVRQSNGELCYKLGDFGLANWQNMATSNSGTPLYVAPEIGLGGKQTPKADMWSLYATLAWVLDVDGFRAAAENYKTNRDVWRGVIAMASKSSGLLDKVREMAAVAVDRRASAAQMLVKHYGGVGLTTPRSRVPPLLPWVP